MRTSMHHSRKLGSAITLAVALAAAACSETPLPSAADADVASITGSDGGGGRLYRVEPSMFPFYARTDLDPDGRFGYRTDEWAAFVFYRNPECVPADFNLLDFYEAGPLMWRVFSCPATVTGFSLHVEPFGMTPPKQSLLRGSAVPIWFAPWDSELAMAIESGHLTMSDLESTPGLLKGVATHFQEVLHSTDNHPRPRIGITAHGGLEDGRQFHYGVTWNGLTADDIQRVDIRFR